MAEGLDLQDYLTKFDLKTNPDWINLFGDHEAAHKKGQKAHGLERTVDLTSKQIIDTLAKYIDAYENHLTGTANDANFKAYRAKLSRTRAEQFLQDIRRRGRGAQEYSDAALQLQGLDKLFSAYRENKANEDLQAYQQAITSEFVDPQDADSVDSLAKQIIKNNPAQYSEKDLHSIKMNIHGHLLQEGEMYKSKHQDTSVNYQNAA